MRYDPPMRSVSVCLFGIVVLLWACGGKAVIDAAGDGGADGGAGGTAVAASTGATMGQCDGKSCGTDCTIGDSQTPNGQCNEAAECVYEAVCADEACRGQPPCATCVVCNQVECLEGFCNKASRCDPVDPCQ